MWIFKIDGGVNALYASSKINKNETQPPPVRVYRLFYIPGGCEIHSHSGFFVVWEDGALDGLLQTAGAFGGFIFRRDTQHTTRAL